jgi:hypothetical protein
MEEGTAVLRRLQAFFVLSMCVISSRAAAQEPTDAPEEPTDQRPADEPQLAQVSTEPRAADSALEGWHTEVSGYFRAPIAMGISSRPPPDNQTGPKVGQVSYGPNRTIDASYFSFAYTRLQEQDWAEVFIHAKKKHVDAAVGWMGYWYQSAGFRNPDAAWVPGMAYLTLDTDFELATVKPNISATMGAWWPAFGSFPKYDTYTLGRFRQVGEQVTLTVPVNADITVALVEGFGTSRDGSFNILSPPFYGSVVGLDLMTWWNARFTYGKLVDAAVHFNTEWTTDPNLTQNTIPGDKSYGALRKSHLSTIGGELSVTVPYAGRLWISPSYIHVINGWALANGGTEVMHSLGGAGIAGNYLAYSGSPPDSTGSGSLFNLGFLYENTLSGIQGKAGGSLPEVTLNVFGLMANASLDLPATSSLTQDSIKQFKFGADVTLQALTWVAFTLRADSVNYDQDNSGFIFAAITPRVSFFSHWLSGERMYIQYSRYFYGDEMVLNASWPWGAPLVAGANVFQQGPYSQQKPDENIVKLQADIAF